MSVLAGVISGVGSLLGGIAGAVTQGVTNNQNIAFQRETNEKNEQLLRESWARDDSSIQRRVADAFKAGVNPLAVLGSAPNTSPIKVDSPHADPVPVPNLANAVANAITMSQEFASKDAEINLLKAQSANIAADTNYKATSTFENKVQIGNTALKYLDNLRDMQRSGTLTHTQFAKLGRELGLALGIRVLGDNYSDFYEAITKYVFSDLPNNPLVPSVNNGLPMGVSTNNVSRETIPPRPEIVKRWGSVEYRNDREYLRKLYPQLRR